MMAAAPAAPTVLVAGGTGFVGLRVCREAVARGLRVVSLSRSGMDPAHMTERTRPAHPDTRTSTRTGTNRHRHGHKQSHARHTRAHGCNGSSSLTYTCGCAAWMRQVTWVRGDALQPAQYREHMRGCLAIVHSVGLLFEVDWLTRRLFPSSAAAQRAPSTYESACYETAATLLHEARAAGVPTYVYVSAVDPPPGVMTRYLAAKRRAESELLAAPTPRAVILRPGILYGSERWYSLPLMAVFTLLHRVGLTPADEAPLPVADVAKAAVNACLDPNVRGILNVPAIARVAAAAPPMLPAPAPSPTS
jgi:uncharacterized protein YbjT (DUF2867 family)